MTSVGKTKEIEIELSLLQGSTLSPLLFVIMEEIGEGTPRAMLFADDPVVFCDPCRGMIYPKSD